jgi:hypothetical protein
MRARAVIVGELLGKDAAQVSLAEDDHVVEALAADGANDPLDEGILPGGSRRGEDLLDVERLDASTELVAVHTVAVAKEISECRAPGKRLSSAFRRVAGDAVHVLRSCRLLMRV